MSAGSVILIALLALAAGLVAGALLWRTFGPHQERNRDLEKRLEEAEQRFSHYQNQVTEHFVETSRRVNELTRNYREVHEYLASSAVQLTSPSIGREMRAAAQIESTDEPRAGGDGSTPDDSPEPSPEPIVTRGPEAADRESESSDTDSERKSASASE